MPDDQPTGNAPSRRVIGFAQRIAGHRFWTSTKGILTGLAAIATVIGVAIKFVPSSEACDSNTARLLNAQIHTTTLEAFLRRTTSEDPTEGRDPETLDDPVTWASVAISVVGHKGKWLTLKWSMVDATSGVSGELPTDRTAAHVQPPGCATTALREEVLVEPFLPSAGKVYVTFDLIDETNERLPPNEVRTPTIDVTT